MIAYVLVNGGSASLNPKDALTFNKQLMTFTTDKAARKYCAALESLGLEVKDLTTQKVSIKLILEES